MILKFSGITDVYHLGKSIQDDDVLGDLPCFEARSHSPLDILLLSQVYLLSELVFFYFYKPLYNKLLKC